MGKIAVLSKETVDQIAAGEVVERPSSVVKELAENAIDAGASIITVEIKEGGTSLIRITDNGSGIDAAEIKTAFLSHATSKITSVEDLLTANSLGFRGEALPSIASVAKMEMISKTASAFTGNRYVIEGGEEKAFEEIGCPDGTTFLVRDLFYNVPARRKFLKTSMSEAGYCAELLQRLSLCHPELSFRFISNGKVMFQTSGNGDLRDVVYQLFGREIAQNSIPVAHKEPLSEITLSGMVGKPMISRGNRNYEIYFVNGRYIKSSIIGKAVEEAYRPFMMQHKYPFTVLSIGMDPLMLDVNVHPAKLEVRFSDSEAVYYAVYHAVKNALTNQNMIPKVPFGKEEKTERKEPLPPATRKELLIPKTEMVQDKKTEYFVNQQEIKTIFETDSGKLPPNGDKSEKRTSDLSERTGTIPKVEPKVEPNVEPKVEPKVESKDEPKVEPKEQPKEQKKESIKETIERVSSDEKQEELPNLLRDAGKKEFRLIGQVFQTYFLIEMEDQLFLIDQHAAHEKVLYEQTMKQIRKNEVCTQQISPPFLFTLSLREAETLSRHGEVLQKLGYEFEPFGGKDYKVTGIPANLCGVSDGSFFLQLLDEMMNERMVQEPEALMEKVASLSCKAAVKGNTVLSLTEAEVLIEQLLTLDNPYHCPHGRPTTISMSRQELEKKFKRIV